MTGEDGVELVETVTMTMLTEEDIVVLRQKLRSRAKKLGFSEIGSARLLTAASEIARNAITYGFGGRASVSIRYRPDAVVGIEVVVEDDGPGITDIDLAMTDGHSTAGSLGRGLGGASRLADEFRLTSGGGGTRVALTCWA